MEWTLARHLELLQPLLKQRWAARLRRLPAVRAGAGFITPEMLVLMVDSTLRQLVAGHGRPLPADWEAQRAARFSPARAGCQCGLDILLTYYVAGAWALRDVMPATLSPHRRRVLRHFMRLARHEVSALCGVCVHRQGTFCRSANIPSP
jgi:hypothetical protein